MTDKESLEEMQNAFAIMEAHIKKCHEVLYELVEIAAWEYPFRITPIIDKAIKVLKEVA